MGWGISPGGGVNKTKVLRGLKAKTKVTWRGGEQTAWEGVSDWSGVVGGGCGLFVEVRGLRWGSWNEGFFLFVS